jgi:E1A/CREB-binding protein
MILESLAVVQAQLGEVLSETPGYTTLQSDGTTKFGQHYAALDVKDSSTTYSLGLRQVFSGAAKDTLETLKEILDDIDVIQRQLGREAVSSRIVMKIKNTMSDRHVAEKAFNDLLQEFRADILPIIAENWRDMRNEEKEQLTRMNNFFCGLHFLVELAKSAEEALILWEAQCLDTSVSSSGTQRLIRTACKAFHHRGSQQSGCSASFRTYLRRHGIYRIPLAAFIGNRFNILFYDAAGVYYLKDHMIEYIESTHGQQANRLLQAVLDDLKQSVYISGCRALGLIDKAVTGPLWRKLEESNVSVLDMGTYYTEMKTKFDSWSTDSRALAEGTACLSDDIPIHKDDVWNVLVASNDLIDTMTLEALQILFSAFSITTQRLLVDHLPGGIYSSFDNDLYEEVASVPTTNMSPERDFAMLDRLMREKPNATAIALESIILYSHNKTSKWLDQKSREEKGTPFEAAQIVAPVMRKKFKERREVIETRSVAALQQKQNEIQRKHFHAIKEKEMLTKEIEKLDLWTSKCDITNGLAQFSRKFDKLRALKLQIKFRHIVMNQTHPDKSLFKFSHKGKQYSITQLTENLCHLLGDDSASYSDTPPSPEMIMIQPELLIGRKIKHQFEVQSGKLVW